MDVKGDCFKKEFHHLNKGNKNRPLLLVYPGVTGTSNSTYVENIVIEAYEKRGFDVVGVNYRGLNGCKLTTPRFYMAETVEDILEPMYYIYNKYCKK